jgi:hypothetical protein
VKAARPTGTIGGFVGLLAGRTKKVATIEEISEATAQGWAFVSFDKKSCCASLSARSISTPFVKHQNFTCAGDNPAAAVKLSRWRACTAVKRYAPQPLVQPN